jgi:hypothetical protein
MRANNPAKANKRYVVKVFYNAIPLTKHSQITTWSYGYTHLQALENTFKIKPDSLKSLKKNFKTGFLYEAKLSIEFRDYPEDENIDLTHPRNTIIKNTDSLPDITITDTIFYSVELPKV